MSAFTDIIKLAYKNNGKMPNSIPSHYIQHVYAIHRQSKGLTVPNLKYDKNRTMTIRL